MDFYITAASDARSPESTPLEEFCEILNSYGTATCSPFLFDRGDGVSASAQVRAKDLSQALATYDYVLDISGGNRSNEILHHLDVHDATGTFVGYSDLSTIHSALAAHGIASLWFQPIHITMHDEIADAFKSYVHGNRQPLTSISYRHACGDKRAVDGVLSGGNLRTLLKLAGTPYFPPTDDRLFLIEGRTSEREVIIPQFAQLRDMGLFDSVAGVLLGTFTTFEKDHPVEDLFEIVADFTGDLPVYRTDEIGHATDAKASALGARYHLDPGGSVVQIQS